MMRVERIGRHTVYLADCLSPFDQFEPRTIDAIICDPPYCSGAVSEAHRTRAKGQGLRSETLRKFGWFTGDNMGTAGLQFLLRSIAVAGSIVVRETGSMVFFCDWRMLPMLAPAIESAGVRYQGLVCWDKMSMGLGTGFRAQSEYAMHFTLGAPEYHDMGTANVLRVARVSADDREHQAQKPVDLMKQLVRVVAPPGGLVCDPFAGSGSTGVACEQTGRTFIGFENDPEHFATCCRRLANEVERHSMFEPDPPAVQMELLP